MLSSADPDRTRTSIKIEEFGRGFLSFLAVGFLLFLSLIPLSDFSGVGLVILATQDILNYINKKAKNGNYQKSEIHKVSSGWFLGCLLPAHFLNLSIHVGHHDFVGFVAIGRIFFVPQLFLRKDISYIRSDLAVWMEEVNRGNASVEGWAVKDSFERLHPHIDVLTEISLNLIFIFLTFDLLGK